MRIKRRQLGEVRWGACMQWQKAFQLGMRKVTPVWWRGVQVCAPVKHNAHLNSRCAYKYVQYKHALTCTYKYARVQVHTAHLTSQCTYEYVPYKWQATPWQSIHVQRAYEYVRVQVRISPLVAHGSSIEVRRNSNKCAFKKKWPKRNIERRREHYYYT